MQKQKKCKKLYNRNKRKKIREGKLKKKVFSKYHESEVKEDVENYFLNDLDWENIIENTSCCSTNSIINIEQEQQQLIIDNKDKQNNRVFILDDPEWDNINIQKDLTYYIEQEKKFIIDNRDQINNPFFISDYMCTDPLLGEYWNYNYNDEHNNLIIENSHDEASWSWLTNPEIENSDDDLLNLLK